MNPPSRFTAQNPAAVSSADSAPSPARESRLVRFFDAFFRHAGAIAIDHTHMLPLDRVSGRTGIVKPRTPARCCC